MSLLWYFNFVSYSGNYFLPLTSARRTSNVRNNIKFNFNLGSGLVYAETGLHATIFLALIGIYLQAKHIIMANKNSARKSTDFTFRKIWRQIIAFIC